MLLSSSKSSLLTFLAQALNEADCSLSALLLRGGAPDLPLLSTHCRLGAVHRCEQLRSLRIRRLGGHPAIGAKRQRAISNRLAKDLSWLHPHLLPLSPPLSPQCDCSTVTHVYTASESTASESGEALSAAGASRNAIYFIYRYFTAKSGLPLLIETLTPSSAPRS